MQYRKYKNGSFRTPTWNYAWAATYFITIKTFQNQQFFGRIADGENHLSSIGQIVECEWLKTPLIRPDMNISLGEYVVMPDHFHGLITIGQNPFNGPNSAPSNQFTAQRKNLGSIIRGFKGTVTRYGRKIVPDFKWQLRYYDTIIKDDDHLKITENYIKENVSKWGTKHP